MRYREGTEPAQQADNPSGEVLLFSVSLALVIGCVLLVLGYKGKQMWLMVWSAGLILSSVIYIAYEYILDIPT